MERQAYNSECVADRNVLVLLLPFTLAAILFCSAIRWLLLEPHSCAELNTLRRLSIALVGTQIVLLAKAFKAIALGGSTLMLLLFNAAFFYSHSTLSNAFNQWTGVGTCSNVWFNSILFQSSACVFLLCASSLLFFFHCSRIVETLHRGFVSLQSLSHSRLVIHSLISCFFCWSAQITGAYKAITSVFTGFNVIILFVNLLLCS